MKTKISYLLLLVVACQFSYAQPVGPGDWSSIRLYGHAYNVNGFSDDEYDWIKNHNHIFTTEKRHARNIYGDPSSEFASNIASLQINKNNPSSVPLFYWNAIIVYDGIYQTIKDALKDHPEYLNADGKFDYSNADFRQWWVDVATNQINNGADEGIFIDAVPNVHSTQPESMDELHNMMDQLPGFVLYNGFYTSGSKLLGGLETLEHADGVYVETFFHYSCNTAAKGKLMMDALLQVPADKYIITNNLPEKATWNATDHQFGMAAHLIIANENSFHRYYLDGGYATNSLTIWHEDFGKYLGPPKAKATVNGYVYTRSFENAEVTLDLENKTSSIVWGSLTGPAESSSSEGSNSSSSSSDGITNNLEQISVNSLDLKFIKNGHDLTITSNSTNIYQVEVFDILGKNIQTKTEVNGTKSMNLSFDLGVSILRITTTSGAVFFSKTAVLN